MNKNNKRLFVWIVFTFSYVLFPMQRFESITSDAAPVLHADEIALRLVCRYLDDHREIFSFAETNKAYHNYMLGLANTRKKLLPQVIIGEHLGSVRHKYGSIYCQAYRQKDLNELVLTYSILKDGQPSQSNDHLIRFISPLPYKQAPFVNDKGKLCFYGYGMIDLYHETDTFLLEKKDKLTIVQYQSASIESAPIQSVRLQCLMAKKGDEVSGRQMYRRFDFCMEYPFLLKAILNSSHVTNSSDDQELIFWLDGVTIPNNYAEKVPIDDLSDNWVRNKLEHLPAIIKDFITKK